MEKFLTFLSLGLTTVSLIVAITGKDKPYQAKSFSLEDYMPNEKYWVLADYTDSVLVNKSIAKYSDNHLAWSAVLLRIENDTVYTSGTLNTSKFKKVSINMLGVSDSYGKFNFFYDILSKSVKARDFSSDETRGRVYTYQAISEADYKKLMEFESTEALSEGISHLFTEGLFTGEYESLDHKSPQMTMDATGKVEGFQKFTHFTIHNYFGTSHPFDNKDVAWFEGKGQKGKYYNWAFSGDTLTLTEMVAQNNEEYFPGKNSFRFVKSKNS